MNIKMVAFLLLIGRIVSVWIMIAAMKRQHRLNKFPVRPGLENFRLNLNRLTWVIFLGNMVPIVVDVLTILSPTGLRREDTPSSVGIFYAISNCLTAIICSLFIWTIYRQAENTVILLDEEEEKKILR